MASIPSTMRAIVSNLPQSESPAAEFKTIPVPTPAAGEVLVKLRASGLNPSDAANAFTNRFRRESPAVVGRDFAGVVVSSPSDRSLEGARVWGGSGDALSLARDGTHAEYLCVPADGVARIPDGVSFAQAGAMGTPYSTAWIALDRARLAARGPAERGPAERQQVVLVLAATGAVGRAAAQIAAARGHRVVTTSRRDGMDINIAADPQLKKMVELTAGKGADVVVDGAGDPDLARAALAVMARGGRYAVITAKGGAEVQVDFRQLYARSQSIVGVNSGSLSLRDNQRAMQEIADYVTAGKIRVDKEEVFDLVPFADALDSYQKAMAFDGKKYVFVFDE